MAEGAIVLFLIVKRGAFLFGQNLGFNYGSPGFGVEEWVLAPSAGQTGRSQALYQGPDGRRDIFMFAFAVLLRDVPLCNHRPELFRMIQTACAETCERALRGCH